MLIFGTAAIASAQCSTQGALAIALAQLLGYDVQDDAAAIAALIGVGVQPEGGWQSTDCIDEAAVAQLNQSIQTAAAAGLLNAGDASGALAAALDAIGEHTLASDLSPWPSHLTASGDSPMGGRDKRHREPRGGVDQDLQEEDETEDETVPPPPPRRRDDASRSKP
jgi:hypothetical protein